MHWQEKTHGDSKVYLKDNIVFAKLSGMFNELGAEKFTNEVKRLVLSLADQPFGILIDDLDLEGGTPEAFAILEQYNQWLNTKPLKAKAMVMSSNAHKEIINKLSPSRNKQNIQYFLTEPEAVAWLQTELEQVK